MTWRPASPVDRQLVLLWAAVAGAILILAPISGIWLGKLPACPFRALTGIPCPSCGAARATGALLRGDLLAGFSWNPLFAVASMSFVFGGLLAPVWIQRVGLVPELRGVLLVRIGLVVALGGNWAYLWLRGV